MTELDAKIKANVLDFTQRAFLKTKSEGKKVYGSYFPRGTDPYPSVQVDISSYDKSDYAVTYCVGFSMWNFIFTQKEVESSKQ